MLSVVLPSLTFPSVLGLFFWKTGTELASVTLAVFIAASGLWSYFWEDGNEIVCALSLALVLPDA